VVMVPVVVFLPAEVSAAFYYSALAGQAPVASHGDFLRRVFASLVHPGRHPEPCYRTETKSVPDLAVALAPVLAVLPVLRLASEVAEKAWDLVAAVPVPAAVA
jgi:hypothetical protein